MSKNLEEKFRSFCNSKNLEINQNQITTIKLLQDFYNKNFHSSIFNIFKTLQNTSRVPPSGPELCCLKKKRC